MRTQALAGLSFMRKGQTVYALSALAESQEVTARLKVVSVGLPFVRLVGHYLKPTSAALRLLAKEIWRNRMSLELNQALELVWAGQIELPHSLEEGYVLLEIPGLVLGCGLALPGRIKSQIPRREIRALLGGR